MNRKEKKEARKHLSYSIPIPEGVTVTFTPETREITVQGPKGTLTRRFAVLNVTITIQDNTFRVEKYPATKKDKRLLHTLRAHVRNMLKGVTEGHTYKVRAVSSHFPMTISKQGNELIIKNFYGEKKPRVYRIPKNVNVDVKGNEIIITSIDKEAAGNAAGALEKLTRRPAFDTRIFQDGLYIVEKDGKPVMRE